VPEGIIEATQQARNRKTTNYQALLENGFLGPENEFVA
jgi:hypothetical protein